MATLFASVQDRCVEFYLRICPNPPGAGPSGSPRPAAPGDRVSQLLAFLALGLPLAAVVPLLTWLLPTGARVIVLAWVLASLFFLASVDMRAKARLEDAARQPHP